MVKICFTSDYCPTSSYVLKDGLGLVAEVILYECKDYGTDHPYSDMSSFYLIEYKLIPSSADDEFRYVSEQYLYPVEENQ